jgi:ATP-dependent DNA helicase RecQ
MGKTPKEVLYSVWGFSSFREPQELIIDNILKKKDTVALLPTGGGKSLCYQVPALCMDGICLVISPLIALMKDQVRGLKNVGVSAEAVFSGMSHKEIDNVFNNCIQGVVKLLYLSPERLMAESTLSYLQQMKLSFVAIDEAHCISQWGFDFRPAYRKITLIKNLGGHELPFLALTASATPSVLKDILLNLELKDAKVFRKSFARPNLAYRVVSSEDKLMKIATAAKRINGSGIVYCRSRKKTVDLASYLSQSGILTAPYHAGLRAGERDKVQDLWTQGKVKMIAATTAFGMGIDKGDVRFVLHLDLPESIEAYYQEAGRAGRDGDFSYCALFYSPDDYKDKERRWEAGIPDVPFVKNIYNCLYNHYNIGYNSGANQTHDFDLELFCRKYHLAPIATMNSLKILEVSQYLILTDEVLQPAKVQILLDRLALYDFQLRYPKFEGILQQLMRLYSGILSVPVPISENKLGLASSLTPQTVISILEYLSKHQVISYSPLSKDPKIIFLYDRFPGNEITIDKVWMQNKFDRERERLKAVEQYLLTSSCKSVFISRYFGEEDAQDCKQCSSCLLKYGKPEDAKSLQEQILNLLRDRPRLPEELLGEFSPELHKEVSISLQNLYYSSKIHKTNTGKLECRGIKK